MIRKGKTKVKAKPVKKAVDGATKVMKTSEGFILAILDNAATR